MARRERSHRRTTVAGTSRRADSTAIPTMNRATYRTEASWFAVAGALDHLVAPLGNERLTDRLERRERTVLGQCPVQPPPTGETRAERTDVPCDDDKDPARRKDIVHRGEHRGRILNVLKDVQGGDDIERSRFTHFLDSRSQPMDASLLERRPRGNGWFDGILRYLVGISSEVGSCCSTHVEDGEGGSPDRSLHTIADADEPLVGSFEDVMVALCLRRIVGAGSRPIRQRAEVRAADDAIHHIAVATRGTRRVLVPDTAPKGDQPPTAHRAIQPHTASPTSGARGMRRAWPSRIKNVATSTPRSPRTSRNGLGWRPQGVEVVLPCRTASRSADT